MKSIKKEAEADENASEEDPRLRGVDLACYGRCGICYCMTQRVLAFCGGSFCQQLWGATKDEKGTHNDGKWSNGSGATAGSGCSSGDKTFSRHRLGVWSTGRGAGSSSSPGGQRPVGRASSPCPWAGELSLSLSLGWIIYGLASRSSESNHIHSS